LFTTTNTWYRYIYLSTLLPVLLLSQVPDKFYIAYLDEIVVYSNSLEEHREHVRLILAKLQEACLYLKLSKCKFEV
jgi:TFIIF-interacting CTD phosphatase-like protein